MHKVIHCKINMFDRNALFVLEENGEFKELKQKISITELDKKLPALAREYGAKKIHFIGTDAYLKGLVKKIQKQNLEFSHFNIGVN